MRPILAASLLLSPMLLTASAVASQPKVDNTATSPSSAVSPAISTGVTAPEILDTQTLRIQPNAYDKTAAPEEQVVLQLKVDDKGRAQNIQVVKSTNPHFDARVIEAVQRSHFRPAKLDNQAVPMELSLVVVIQPAVQ